MEPSDDEFAKHHIWYDHGKGHLKGDDESYRDSQPVQSSFLGKGHYELPKLKGDDESFRDSHLVQSVFLADGIHNSVTDESSDSLPNRTESNSIKAKATWIGTLFLAGIGMFVEAYVIITTGQVKLVWHDQYPECWVPESDAHCPENIECCDLFPNTPSDENGTCTVDWTVSPHKCNDEGLYQDRLLCSARVTGSISYAEFAGIMAGMLTFGALADVIGRKAAGSLTSLFMIIGIVVMTYVNAENTNTLFTLFSVFFAIFGLGVGGEYPLTASGAADQDAASKEDALLDDNARRQRRVLLDKAKTVRRGETIALVFTMQGIGAVVGSVILLSLIYFSNQNRITCDDPASNSTGNDEKALNAVWRSFYLVGMIFVLMVLVYRTLVLEEGNGHAKLMARKQRREEKLGRNALTAWKVLKFYGPRLLGTGGNWFVWDITFYGLKLFSGPIFDSINPAGDLAVQNGWLLFNNVCALLGYFCAAAVIDVPVIGRKRLQMFSYTMCTILFYLTAGLWDKVQTPVIMFLYFASSFFGNFGCNVTTYVMAAETYPTELRGTCHGLSAFLGKLGALIATIIFNELSTVEVFWVCGSVSVAGFLFTLFFSVDLTHVSLAEHDAQLELFLEGRAEDYRGKLNKPRHLSLWETLTGKHGEYDPDWAVKLVREEKTKTLHSLQEANSRGNGSDSGSVDNGAPEHALKKP